MSSVHVRDWVPPLLWRVIRQWGGGSMSFRRSPGSWRKGLAISSGYSQEEILTRVVLATRAVVSGQAIYERDSVLFHEPALPFQILAPLLRAAALNHGVLNVVDIGGALGSTFRQCRAYLGPVGKLRWYVVEQPHFVAAGNREFAGDELTFVESLPALPPMSEPCVVLASSVLQYLEKPDELLGELRQLNASALVVDRTPLSSAPEHRLCIQHVSSRIYPASYPCWVLSRPRVIESLSGDWRVSAEFSCPEGSYSLGLSSFEFRGILFERRNEPPSRFRPASVP